MIYDLSVRLTSRLEKRGYLPDSEEEIVAYGLFSLLSKLMYAVICLILGLIFSVPLESMIFYAVFLFVKKYGGGFPASTEDRNTFVDMLCFLRPARVRGSEIRRARIGSGIHYNMHPLPCGGEREAAR